MMAVRSMRRIVLERRLVRVRRMAGGVEEEGKDVQGVAGARKPVLTRRIAGVWKRTVARIRTVTARMRRTRTWLTVKVVVKASLAVSIVCSSLLLMLCCYTCKIACKKYFAKCNSAEIHLGMHPKMYLSTYEHGHQYETYISISVKKRPLCYLAFYGTSRGIGRGYAICLLLCTRLPGYS